MRIGIDVGGTFTDFAVWDGDPAGYSAVEMFKVPSTPPRFSRGVIAGLEKLVSAGRIRPADQVLIVHGTTVSTNATIERSGPPIALLVTKGFRDVLGMARLRLDQPIDMFGNRPSPLIPRQLVFEIEERTLANGRIERTPDLDVVVRAASEARRLGAASIAICFLHSYRNGDNEVAARDAIRSAVEGADVVMSHEVWPQQGEYERAMAALLNAYARRSMASYIAEIEAFLKANLPGAQLLITKSNGGVMAADEATHMPIHTLLSGPSAGVAAARVLGRMLDEPNLLTMDMGGTSTDISLIRDFSAMVSHEGKVGDFPIMMPVTAIEAIGAGGGSIAWMDGPVLKVGPRSAGAVPGPACYGRGGTQPTVSDAYLLCGYLSDEVPLAGGLKLDRTLAERSMEPIMCGMRTADPVQAAEGCLAVATANMLSNALPFIARLGLEPSKLTLMIFGGAGGIHGPLLAEEIGIGRVVVPRCSSVFCAFGCLVSDLMNDQVRSVHGQQLASSDVRAIYDELGQKAQRWLDQQSAGDLTVGTRFEYSADVRYKGQSFDVNTPLPADAAGGAIDVIESAFHEEHHRLYGHSEPGQPIEILALRLRACGSLLSPGAVPQMRDGAGVEPRSKRAVRFGGYWHDTAIYAAEDLPAGWTDHGPAIIEQETSTIVIPPAFSVEVGPFGDLVLRRD